MIPSSSSRSLYALTSSPHNQDEPFYIGAVPRDLLIKIFSCLSWANLGTIAQVCKEWRKIVNSGCSFAKKLHLFSKLATNPSVTYSTLFPTSNKTFTGIAAELDSTHFILKQSIFSNGTTRIENLLFFKLNENSVEIVSTIPHANVILCETSRFIFTSKQIRYLKGAAIFEPNARVTCVNKQTGQIVFSLNLDEAPTDQEKIHYDPLRACLIVQERPLTFLTVTEGGTVKKWEFSKKQPKCVETWNLYPEEEKTEKVSEAFIMTSSSLLVCTHEKEHQKHTLRLFSLDSHEATPAINLSSYWGLHKVSDSLVILENSQQFLCFSVTNKQISLLWTRARNNREDIIGLKKSQVILNKYHYVLIFDTKTGKTLKSIPFHDHALSTNIKQYGDFLLVKRSDEDRFDLLDIKSKQFSTHQLAPSPYDVTGFALLDDKLLILRFDHFQVLTLPQKAPVAQAKENLPLPANPLPHPPIQQKRTCQKVALVVLFLLFVASISLMLYFSFHRALNLSIGFGTSTLLTGLGAGYLAHRASLKHTMRH